MSISLGLHFNLPEETYNRDPEWRQLLRRGDLVAMADSPALCAYERENSKDSPAMKLGRAIHSAVLEPEEFDKWYICAPAVNKRTNAGKEELTNFMLANPGKAVMEEADWSQTMAVRAAVRKHPIASRFMAPATGYTEVTAVWVDAHGNRCKARFDKLVRNSDGRWTIIDLKSARSASRAGVRQAWNNYLLFLQSVFYRQGLKMALEQSPSELFGDGGHADFWFCFFQKTPPYLVRFNRLADKSDTNAEMTCEHLQSEFAKCRETGNWEDRADRIEELEVPPWLITDTYSSE